MLLMQAGDSLTDISGYCQQDCGCKMIRAGGCLIQLASNTKLNLSQPQTLQFDCNQGNHSVVKATNLHIGFYLYLSGCMMCNYYHGTKLFRQNCIH